MLGLKTKIKARGFTQCESDKVIIGTKAMDGFIKVA
jgi:hypothetical protein